MGGGGEAHAEALLAGGEAEGESDMGLADAAWAEQDYVLAARDVFAAGEIQHQHLVERRDRLEAEAPELCDDREPGLLDTPLDEAALAVDQLQLHQPGQEPHMIQALGRALARQFLVFPQEGRQLQPLQVMLEQDAGGGSQPWPAPPASRVVFSDIALEGSATLQMTGWAERRPGVARL